MKITNRIVANAVMANNSKSYPIRLVTIRKPDGQVLPLKKYLKANNNYWYVAYNDNLTMSPEEYVNRIKGTKIISDVITTETK